MEALLEQLIADFQERRLPPLTSRQAALPWVSGKIDTVIGMRRSGKTWFLYQVVGELVRKGYPRESIVYLNFEDERLLPLTTSDLHLIPDVFYRRNPALRDRECVFMFDEIQQVSGWERFVRRITDTENVHICLTGSSAKLLSREIATSLRGRALATEMFPFSFSEALLHSGVDPAIKARPGARARSLFEGHLQRYLIEGGFPEIQGLETQIRIRILQSYLDVVILRDIIERHQVQNVPAIRALIRHAVNNPARTLSVSKFYNDLRSQGIAVAKDTLYDYLEYLVDAYLLFLVPIHSRSERVRRVNPRKLYIIDPGLAVACSHNTQPDLGHLLENFVFLVLRRMNRTIEYYRTANGREVDFLASGNSTPNELIQVSLDMRHQATRDRETSALEEAMQETQLRHATIVTLHDEDKLKTSVGTIDIVPAWSWALRQQP